MSKYYGVQGVYALVNVNKKSVKCPLGRPYVGQTASKPTATKHKMGVAQRICDHRSKLRKGMHHNPKLQAAWDKYKEASFVFVVVERVDDRCRLKEREQYWINEWDSCDEGYNCKRIAEFEVGYRRRTDLTVSIIKDWVIKYHDAHGKYPTAKSGKVAYAPLDEPLTWKAVSACLRNGYRGLPGGSSLPDFIVAELGVVTRKTAKKLDDIFLRQAIEKYCDDFGYYPTKRSGIIVCGHEYGRLDWNAVNELLRTGQRGLPGGSSLCEFVKANATRPVMFKHWYNKKGHNEGKVDL